MSMMGSRVTNLAYAFDGLQQTHVPLVAKSAQGFFPAGFADDQGLYYFIPWMARATGLSFQVSAYLFLFSIVLAGWLLGSWGFWKIFKPVWLRLAASALLLVFCLETYRKVEDIYLVMLFTVLAFVPNLLAFSRNGKNSWKELWPWFTLGTVVLGYCNFIRSQSGNGILLFMAVWLVLNNGIPWKRKVPLFLVLLACSQVSVFHFKALWKNRDAYLQANQPGYQLPVNGHPFWHSVYIGFGYLPNPYGLQYADEVAAAKVASVDPKIPYCSPQYEKVLEGATLDFVRSHPLFALKTFFMKALKLLGYAAFFANAGILCAFYRRIPWAELLPMLVCGAFYALPGLLVVPFKIYALGMIAMALVFGIYAVGLALEKYLQQRQGAKPWN